MKFNIHGKNVKVTPAIKEYIEAKVSKLDKYLLEPDTISANVVIRISGKDQIVEVTVPMPKLILRAEERSADLYSAIDLVGDKLERQIRKNKTKLLKKTRGSETILLFDNIEETACEELNKSPRIVKRKNVENKPMSEEEAILQMEMLGHPFFVFQNSENNVNEVLYKRNDGDYGIIELK